MMGFLMEGLIVCNGEIICVKNITHRIDGKRKFTTFDVYIKDKDESYVYKGKHSLYGHVKRKQTIKRKIFNYAIQSLRGN